MAERRQEGATSTLLRGEVSRLGFLTNVIAQGPIPAEEAIARLLLLLERSGSSKVTEGRMLWSLSLLQAMSGEIVEERRSWSRSLEFYVELGIFTPAHMFRGRAELTAGDPAAAEDPLREGAAVLEAAGEKGWLSTTAAVFAEVLWRLGKGEEAERYALLSDRLATPDDWMSQWQWRAAQAKVLADRDQLSEAETLARVAVLVIDQTDYIKSRGDARMSLAYVLRRAGRLGEATTVLARRSNSMSARATSQMRRRPVSSSKTYRRADAREADRFRAHGGRRALDS